MFRKLVESVLRHKQIILVSFLFLLVCLFLSWKLNIWEDESYTLTTVSNKSFKDLIRASIIFEGQPPVYFIIAFFWGKISNSVIFMRLLSTIFTVSGGLLMYKLYSKNSVNTKWWTIFIVFANPFMIYLATEIRCYSLVVLLSILLISLFQQYYCDQRVPFLKRLIFITISIAAVNTQYFVAFLLFTNAVYLLIKGYKKSLITYLIDMFFVMISLCWVPFYITQQINTHVYYNISDSFIDIVKFMMGRLDEYVLFRHYFPFKIAGYIIEIIILLTILINLFSQRQIKKFFAENLYFVFQIAAIVVCFGSVYPLLGSDLLRIRHTAILFPFIFLLFLRSINYLKAAYITGLLTLAIFLFYLACNFYFYKPFVKDLDVNGGMNYLKGKLKANESVVLIRQRLAIPFVYYLKGPNEINILPYQLDYTKPFDCESLAVPAKKEVVEELFSRISKANNFWVVNFYLIDSLASDIQTVDSLIGKAYTLESDTVICDTRRYYHNYFPIQIRELKRKY